jgi:ABC-type lipoprotein export system ATPase subunit
MSAPQQESTDRAPLLELREVTKRFDAGRTDAPAILRGLDLELAAGESVAVVGPSGSGKSTLLNIIGTLAAPTSGRVLLEGTDLAGLGPDRLAEVRNRRIGFVFQAHHLLPQCTALENVLVPTLVHSDPSERALARERALDLLDQVGLASLASHRPARLSGGECQRIAVVRALINRPRLLLADEPTGALDAATAETLGELLVRLNREEGVALLTVTHSLRLARRMGRVLELHEGRLHPYRAQAASE